MKIISRMLGEKIVIDGHITVTVKAIDAEKMILSIESSENDFSYREELIALEADAPLLPETLVQ